MRRKAVYELRRNLTRRGVVKVLARNWWDFMVRPERVYQIGAQLSGGVFT